MSFTRGSSGGPKKSGHQEQAFKRTVVAPVVFEAEASKPGCKFQDAFVCIYGRPGIGKSTFASCLPGAYFLPTEVGYKFLSTRKTPIPSWDAFTGFIKWAETHKKETEDIQMWVIDTATLLAKFCMYGTCADLEITHPADMDYGKGYEAYYDNLSGWISRLAVLGKGICFVCHENIQEITVNGNKIQHWGPDLPKKPYRIIMDMCDIAIHMSYVEDGDEENTRGKKRCLYCLPSESRDAKDKTKSLPATIPFLTERQAMLKILASYRSGTEEAKREAE